MLPEPPSPIASGSRAISRARISSLLRYAVVLALIAVFAFLAVQAPGFFTPSNLLNILVNNFALLALVSLGMTLVISTGGIDLSVGTSIDMGSLVFISLISSHHPLSVALLGGVLGALAVGVVYLDDHLVQDAGPVLAPEDADRIEHITQHPGLQQRGDAAARHRGVVVG